MLDKLTAFFNKSNNKDKDSSSPELPNNMTANNWFQDRYDRILVQRNLLILLFFIMLILVAISIAAISYVATSKKFDPFVIQVEKDTGSASIVNPIGSEVLSGNDALARFFIKRYVIARETYNPVDFSSLAKKTVRLMSESKIYHQFLSYIRKDENNPEKLLGKDETTYLKVNSWTKMSKERYMFRFGICKTVEGKCENKIAIIDFAYVATELTEQEKDINPVGFMVNGYRVDDDNS